jgi:RNA polymerase sigma factor (sigma-70 family)
LELVDVSRCHTAGTCDQPLVMLSNPSDADLLKRSSVDADAFAAFYRLHAGPVLAYLRYRSGDAESAADLTADVFLAAFVDRRRYRPELGSARGWLLGIANNLLAQDRRRRRRAARARERLAVPPIALVDEEIERAEDALTAMLQFGLAHAIADDLLAEQRAAVLARVVDERSYAEIAAERGAAKRPCGSGSAAGLRDWVS